MPRYYDMDKLAEMVRAKADTLIEGKEAFLYVAKWLDKLPAADVVPKSEVDGLEYKLAGIMHSVDKWLEGDELEKDEVNRAITMREKTLRLIETANAEIERLRKENEILSRNADTAFQDGLNEAQDLYKEQIKAEVARVIFAEIRNIILDDSNDSDETMAYDEQAAAYYEAEFCRIVEQIKQLEKKYTEG